MAQISRPFQIAIAVVALFGAVWVFALNRHSSAPSGGSSAQVASSAATAPSPTVAKGSAAGSASGGSGASSKIYHGSAPGVTGLTRAVAKAHGAVATSEQNAKQLAEKSAQASSTVSPPAASASSQPTGASSSAAKTPAASAPRVGTHTGATKHFSREVPHLNTVFRQQSVEAALKRGRVAVLLFWNPKGADDVVVHRALQQLVSHKGVAVYQAPASQVASFGSITRGVQVYGTPTILIVAKSGKTTVLTGITDAYSIEQAVSEIRHS